MKWYEKHTDAVRALESSLVNPTLMRIYDPDLPVLLQTGASRHAVGAVLEQGYPVAFESRRLPDRGSLGHAYDSELFGIVHTLADNARTEEGYRRITTLKHQLCRKKVSPQLGNWSQKLTEFDLQFGYKPGSGGFV